jgi:hypothetical protein
MQQTAGAAVPCMQNLNARTSWKFFSVHARVCFHLQSMRMVMQIQKMAQIETSRVQVNLWSVGA